MNKIMIAALGLCLCSIASFAFADTVDWKYPLGKDVSSRFAGTVYRNDLIDLDPTYNVPQTNCISFEPGSRSAWHVHGGMVVVGLDGVGLLQIDGLPAMIIRKGDVVQIPAGVSHWHGATKDSRFQQLVIYDKNWKAPAGLKARTGMISDQEYANLELAEAPRKAAPAKGFTFAAEKFNSPNFNRPVYLGRTVTTPNAADAPVFSYVFFPKGVYNKWHMHGEGQILIATDGIGLHQMRNGEIQVMRPGDVAYCPPGETHWHGAAPDSSFAHLAVSPAGKHTVEWYDFLDKKEYKKAAVK